MQVFTSQFWVWVGFLLFILKNTDLSKVYNHIWPQTRRRTPSKKIAVKIIIKIKMRRRRKSIKKFYTMSMGVHREEKTLEN